MWKVKSNRQIREERQLRKQEIDAYEPSFVYNFSRPYGVLDADDPGWVYTGANMGSNWE